MARYHEEKVGAFFMKRLLGLACALAVVSAMQVSQHTVRSDPADQQRCRGNKEDRGMMRIRVEPPSLLSKVTWLVSFVSKLT